MLHKLHSEGTSRLLLYRHANSFLRLFLAALAALLLLPAVHAQESARQCPPKTRTDNVVDDYFGTKIADPYRWLEDQDSPATRAWIAAEDRCTDAALDKLPGRDAIAKRLGELMKVNSTGIPIERGGRYFFMRRTANEDLYVIYMREGAGGADQVLVDPRPLSKDHSTSVEIEGISDDGKLIAYGIRLGGQDQVTVHFLNVDTRQPLTDVLPAADYFDVAITHDDSGVYYSRTTQDGSRASYHAMGSPISSDRELFGKGYAKDTIVDVSLSEDGHHLTYIVSYGAGNDHSEVYVQDIQHHGPMVTIVNDVRAYFEPTIIGNTLYLMTNWKAPNWRVVAVDLKNPARGNWREIIPESSDTMQDLEPAGGELIADYVHDATSSLRIFTPEGKPAGEISLPALGTVGGIASRWNSNNTFLAFSSYGIPQTIYHFNVADKQLTTWAKPNVPFDSKDFAVDQVWFHSKDGTRIPMFLFHKKGLELNGENPTLLTGYGGFDIPVTPYFSEEAVVWAEHGGVWAEGNLRGGGEFGEAWHHAGMMGKKQNVFDDFESAAEWLIQNKYTNTKKLAIQGMSNGGLLMGAALTQKPDLFQAVVCMYPLLDMLRYQKFMVAQWWVPEYGSAENPEQFKYLRAYSPYQNVHQGTKYPAVLFVTGDGDTRVAPLHARKMTALLQASTGSDGPILLMYDTKSGHSGGRPLGKQITDRTKILSFLFWQTGMATRTSP